MAFFESNGMLCDMQQMEIRSKEQEILASKMSDGAKANAIRNLYVEIGLEPGSFYMAKYDTSGGGGHHSLDVSESSDGGDGTKYIVYAFIFLGIWVLADHYAPGPTREVMHWVGVGLKEFFNLCGWLIGWIVRVWNGH